MFMRQTGAWCHIVVFLSCTKLQKFDWCIAHYLVLLNQVSKGDHLGTFTFSDFTGPLDVVGKAMLYRNES